jgi:hypothetical protein
MFKPIFRMGPPDMFICGNDDIAKSDRDRDSRELETLCILWLDYAMRAKSHAHAFKLLRK